MANIVVTGGAGFIGSHLVEELVKQKHKVTVIDDLSTGNAKNLSTFEDKIKFIRGSITDEALLEKIFNGVDFVFHEAAIPSVPRSIDDPLKTHEVNATGTLKVLMSAKAAGVKRVIYASSSSVYGDSPTLPKKEDLTPNPLSPYAATKLMGEYYCKQFYKLYGLETVSLRYFNVFGPRQDPASEYAAVIPKFITLMAEDKQPHIFGDGNQTRDFTFVQNVVDANICAMTAPNVAGEVLNIACGLRISLKELVTQINKILGKSIQPIFDPPRPGDILHSYADITKAQRLLKFKPKIGFEEGLKITVEWFLKQKK